MQHVVFAPLQHCGLWTGMFFIVGLLMGLAILWFYGKELERKYGVKE